MIPDASSPVSQYISFIIAGDVYAVNILRTREIVEHSVISRVPRMPACIVGAMNLRGRVVPVIDLAIMLGLPPTKVSRWTCILIVETDLDGESTRLGLLIDAVGDVLTLSEDQIEPAPTFGMQVRMDQLLGVAKVGEKLVLLLNIDHILSPAELLGSTDLGPSAPGAPPALPGSHGAPAGEGDRP
ncbi:chemotaxis protein CheW [Sorangium cellulosum]|uniref:Chemotaxis protein CheW n=1 Tax=Sorangium cellulosum TaxID=56 RepID=A0A2L0EHB3_SORCE|nr:chemotaxis protein CheW [Sorangium cellulosum]AUX38681.1 chemotaxis protein CheW [Sorangium cellulosum]